MSWYVVAMLNRNTNPKSKAFELRKHPRTQARMTCDSDLKLAMRTNTRKLLEGIMHVPGAPAHLPRLPHRGSKMKGAFVDYG